MPNTVVARAAYRRGAARALMSGLPKNPPATRWRGNVERMASINSVLGPLDVDSLGYTLPHEHVFTASAGIQQTYPELFGDFEVFTNQVAATLAEARAGGVQTLVELSTLDLGRDVRFFADMSRRTGVNII